MTPADEMELRFFAKHCLFLHCHETHIPTAQSAPLITSGFVISVEDEWFFITAGHCLKDIEEKKKQGVIYSDWSIVDSFALAEPRPHHIDAPTPINTIPFDFDDAFKDGCFERGKIDCGFIHLEKPRYRRLLEANGVEPFEGVNCRIPKSMALEFDKYEVFGIPSDQFRDLGNGRFYANIVSITLERLAPDEPGWQEQPSMFHASFPEDFSDHGPDGFRSFKGLSGGPIIGSKFLDDGDGYAVVAIQSDWDEHSKISASYLFPLTEHLDQMMRNFRAYMGQHGAEEQPQVRRNQ